jgi:hypothetical protein
LREKRRDREKNAKAVTADKKPVGARGRLAPQELVETLVLALNAESLEMMFLYLIVHRMAWMALRAIKHSCDSILRQLYTPQYIERESELPFVIGYIFMAASGAQKGVIDSRPMELAVVAFESMINSGAGQIAIDLAAQLGSQVVIDDSNTSSAS